MELFEIKTTTPDAQTSISGKNSYWDIYKITAKNFKEALKKAEKKLNPKLKEEVRSVIYLDQIK